MAKPMDAVEAHLKYLMHVMFSCVLRKLWKIREYPLSLQTPNVQHAKWSADLILQPGSGK